MSPARLIILLALAFLASRSESAQNWSKKVVDDSTLTVNDRLARACVSGDLELVKKMIALGGSPSALDFLYRTPLMYACRFRHREIVRYLCARDADVKANRHLPWLGTTSNPWPLMDVEGGTSLMECAMQGDTGIARILIEYGADIHAESSLGNTALFYAAQEGHVEMVKFLLGKSADIDKVNNFNETALSYAVRANRAEVVNLLLNAKMRPNPFTRASALLAAADSDYYAMAKQILRKPFPADSVSCLQHLPCPSPLLHAARLGRTNFIRLMLASGMDINFVPSKCQDCNVLNAAFAKGKAETVRFLLENGAKYTDGKLTQPSFSRIIASEDVGVVKAVLAHSDSTRFKNFLRKMRDPVSLAPEIFKLRLEILSGNGNGDGLADSLKRIFYSEVSPKQNFGLNAIECLNIAMRSGIQFNYDSLGITALMAHSAAGDIEAMKREIGDSAPRNLFREININATTHHHMTALLYAVLAEKPAAVKLLVENGADVNTPPSEGFYQVAMPLETALSIGNRTMIELLLDKGALMRTKSITQYKLYDYFSDFLHLPPPGQSSRLPLLLALESRGLSDLFYKIAELENPSLTSMDCRLAFVIAAYRGEADIAAYLLKKQPDLAIDLFKPLPDIKASAAAHAFVKAARFGRLPVLNWMSQSLEFPADWKPIYFQGLHFAERHGHKKSADFVMQLAFGVKDSL